MENRKQLHSWQGIGEFTLAGKAVLTLRSAKTGQRYTYKICGKTNENESEFSIWFVSVLYGPDNGSDYAYIGFIKKNELPYIHGKKSKIAAEDKRNKAFEYFWEHIRKGKNAPHLEVWHEGKCGRCNRPLTVPESIESGFGPECIKHIHH